jgi:nitrogen regulatory protein P-II 1
LAEGLLSSLKRAPVEAISVQEVKGFGRQKGYLDEYVEGDFSEAFLPKVEITLYIEDSRVDEMLERLVVLSRTGRMGDGKIFVMPVVSYL